MALIKCPECGKEVSDKATACIHCGYPLNSMDNNVEEKANAHVEKYEDANCWKCPTCGKKLQDTGVHYCPDCDVRFDEPVASQENEDPVTISKAKPANTKRKKVWLVLPAVLLIAFVIWKIVGPKTVESGNKYKHQIWNYKNKCDYSSYCNNQPVTHKIQGPYFTSYYFCDGCWEKYGQKTFNMLAEKNSKSRSSERETDAKICAKKAVEDQLKSPSTAKFCKYTEMTATNLGGNKWKVSGYVDAQNSFGATLRNNWTVTLTLTTSGFTDATVTFK